MSEIRAESDKDMNLRRCPLTENNFFVVVSSIIFFIHPADFNIPARVEDRNSDQLHREASCPVHYLYQNPRK